MVEAAAAAVESAVESVVESVVELAEESVAESVEESVVDPVEASEGWTVMAAADQADPAHLTGHLALQGLTSHSKCPLNPRSSSSTHNRTYVYAPRHTRIHGFSHGFSHGSIAILLDATYCDPTWMTALTSRNEIIEWTIDSNTRLLLAIRRYMISKNNAKTTTILWITTMARMMMMMTMIMMIIMTTIKMMMMMVILTNVRNMITKTTTTTTIRIKCFFIRYFLQENGGEIKLFLCIFT